MNLQNKVAIVTGAASGLGLATCRGLTAAGARVVGFDLDQTRLDEALGVDVKGIAVDVADEGSVKAGVDAVVAMHGRVHIAVNCAGVLGPCKTLSKGQIFPSELWNRVLGVNLTGTFNVIRHAAFAMSANEPDEGGERGVIINTSSGAARAGQMGQAAYSASKAGVIGMTLPIARDLAEHGIRVVSIAPGLFESGMSAGMPQKVSDGLIEKMLFPRRMGKPEEFAGLVRHIVENAYLNAMTIDIDCGTR
ncbi:SDR family NAD(P)-dependent oxidoreductase [Paraburkholderia acidiphila]|uniref:SDR family NAD(P)-dependent oxidoreductase n=1 Tax=Paraburkholderia acidiphila TaxID=2571747 RepID=A0A7Z2JBJ1_9BURK|nr:SDR family NAD(P)-dependent oxidoreductase [Paraburkholderia acidiphila]QGZ58581.1 SDR family NAD(P)-dependent oxidoreductase [Paraburkholderia acidiphila]